MMDHELLREYKESFLESLGEGWYLPRYAHRNMKYHYFRRGRSLCGKYYYFKGSLKSEVDPEEACKICMRKLREKEEASEK